MKAKDIISPGKTMGPYDDPNLAIHTSSKLKTFKYKHGSKGVQTKELKDKVPEYGFGIGSILSLASKIGGKGGTAGSMFGGKTGGLIDKGLDLAKGGGNGGAQPAQPNQTGQLGQGESIMSQFVDPKEGNKFGGAGGIAGKIPVYGQFVKLADQALDSSTAALEPLTERGERLNKYSKGIRKYEGGTPYYAGNEDMGGIIQFQKKNPLHKWDNVGKSAKLFSTVASTLNGPVDKLTGGMATKASNQVGGMAAAIGNTTVGEKDFGGSAGMTGAKLGIGKVRNPTAMQPKNVQPVTNPVQPIATQPVVNPTTDYSNQLSQSTNAGVQNDDLINSTLNKVNLAPLSKLTTPKPAGGLFNTKNLMGAADLKLEKGNRKIKFKSKTK